MLLVNKVIKHRVVLAVLCVVAFAACKKDNPQPQPLPQKTYTQKVIVEKFTTTSCGNCGKADLDIAWFKKHFGSNVISVHYHLFTSFYGGDSMATLDASVVSGEFNVNATPYAAINRSPIPNDSSNIVYPGGSWQTPLEKQLKQTAPCGIALNATQVNNGMLTVEAAVGFIEDITTPAYLTVLLLEDSVTGDTGYWQANYYNQDPNVPELFGRGHPIKSYWHNDVYRKAITPFWGEPIPAQQTKKDKTYTATFTTNISAYKKQHLKVVAFVHGRGTDSSRYMYQILNGQEVHVGQKQAFD